MHQGSQPDQIRWRPKTGTETHVGGVQIVPIYQGNKREAILLFSGFGGTRELWDRHLSKFLDSWPDEMGAKPDVYYCTYPHHKAPWRWGPSITQVTNAVRTAMENSNFLQEKDLYIVAHSLGGLVAQGAIRDSQNLAARTRLVENVSVPFSGLAFLRNVSLKDIFASHKGAARRLSDAAQYLNPLKFKTQIKQMSQGSRFLERFRQNVESNVGSSLSGREIHNSTATRINPETSMTYYSDKFVSPNSAHANPVGGHEQETLTGRDHTASWIDGDHRQQILSGASAADFRARFLNARRQHAQSANTHTGR